MRNTVVLEIARFTGAPAYQVELWDSPLIDFFLRHPERFRAFADTSTSAAQRHRLWFDSYRTSWGLTLSNVKNIVKQQ